MLRRGIVDHHGQLGRPQALPGGVWHQPLPLLNGKVVPRLHDQVEASLEILHRVLHERNYRLLLNHI